MDSIGGYRILGEIARGGMGVVYRGQDPSGRAVALKVLLDQNPEGIERFKREAELAHGLSHPHVVPVYDYGVFQGRPFMVMGYVEGEDLMARLKRDGPLPELEARRLFGCLAEGLQAAHTRGIVHRDVKPQNVLLAGAEVYLGDFGLARSGPSALTATGELLGTPSFMAPEQARGEGRRVGPAADVYGFGATLYTALCGEPPFGGATLYAVLDQVLRAEPAPLRAQRRDDLSPDLEALVQDCLRKDPSERPPIGEVLERLEARAGGPRGSQALPVITALSFALVGSCAGAALTWSLSAAPTPSESAAPNDSAALSPGQASPGGDSLTAAAPSRTRPSEREAEVKAVLDEALGLRAQAQLDAARGRVERALELDPDHAQARLLEGVIAFETGNWTLAEKVSQRLEGAPPLVQADGHYYRGRALLRHWLELPPAPESDAKYLGEARDAFAKASSIDESSARAVAWQGQAHMRLGERAAAEECLARARKLRRHNPHVFVLHHALRPSWATRADYQLRDATFESHMILGAYALMAGDDQGGEQSLALAAALRPSERAGVLSCRADALARRARSRPGRAGSLEDLERARQNLDEALALVSQGSRGWASLLAGRGGVLLSLGRAAEAEEDLRRSVAVEPTSAAQSLLARQLAERVAGELPTWKVSAMKGLLDEAKGFAPDNDKVFHGQHLLLVARIKAMTCDFAAAETFFSAALAVANPERREVGELLEDDRATVIRVLIFRGRSRIEAAILGHPTAAGSSDLRAALGKGAKPHIRSLLVQALRLEGRQEEAEREHRRLAEELVDESPEVLRVTLGLAEGRHDVLVGVEAGNPYSLGAAFGKLDDLEKRVQDAPAESVAHPGLILGLARRDREAKTWGGAGSALDKLLERHPRCSELRFERGLLRAHLGQLEAALQDLELAQKGHPLAWRQAEIAAEIKRLKTLRDAK